MPDRECHEDVTRNGQLAPCDKAAVAYRLDPEEGSPYPVCRTHLRAPYWLTARDQHSELANPEGTRP